MRRILLVVGSVVLIAAWFCWAHRPGRDPVRPNHGTGGGTTVVGDNHSAPPPPVDSGTGRSTKRVWPDRGPDFPSLPGYLDAAGTWNFDPQLRPNGTFATDGVETDPDVSLGISPRNAIETRKGTEECGLFGNPERVDRRWIPLEFWVRACGAAEYIGSPPSAESVAANLSFRLFRWRSGFAATEVPTDVYRISRMASVKVVDLHGGDRTQDFEVALLYAIETWDKDVLDGAVVALEAYLDVRKLQGQDGTLVVRSWPYPFELATSKSEDEDAEAFWWRASTLRAKPWDEADRDLFPLYLEMAKRWPNSFKVNAQLGEVCYHLHRERDAVQHVERAIELLETRRSDEPGTTAELVNLGDDGVRNLKEPYLDLLSKARHVLEGDEEPWRYPKAQ